MMKSPTASAPLCSLPYEVRTEECGMFRQCVKTPLVGGRDKPQKCAGRSRKEKCFTHCCAGRADTLSGSPLPARRAGSSPQPSARGPAQRSALRAGSAGAPLTAAGRAGSGRCASRFRQLPQRRYLLGCGGRAARPGPLRLRAAELPGGRRRPPWPLVSPMAPLGAG